MVTPVMFVGLLIVVAMVWLVSRVVSQGTGHGRLDARERDELLALRGLVDDLKETAWEHRELDSALSVIVLDTIRTFERSRRDGGS
jgi:hypothetical protein